MHEDAVKTTQEPTQLVAPTGRPIIGTLEEMTGVAKVVGWEKNDEGGWDPIWTGSTEIFYDSQHTLEKDGEALFMCDRGREWKGSECHPAPEEAP